MKTERKMKTCKKDRRLYFYNHEFLHQLGEVLSSGVLQTYRFVMIMGEERII